MSESSPDYETLFRSSPDHYLILDPDLVIVAVTQAYADATMSIPYEIIGRHLFDVFPDNPDDSSATGVSALQASLDRVRSDRVPDTMPVQKYDIRRPSDQGGGFEVRYWSPKNSPVFSPDGQLRYIIHRVEDVTELVELGELEREQSLETVHLREHSKRMEGEVLQRSKELQKAIGELRAAAGEKDRFLSRMSHEFRTPLNAISGFAQLLEYENLTKEQRECVEQIIKAGDLMLVLINEVLDISRIASGNMSMSIEPVALSDVVTEAAVLVAPMADARQVTFASHVGREVYALADRQRIKQVLLNLFSNAVKYNRAGGSVSVRVDDSYEGRVLLRVEDTGAGIPADRLERLFEPFDRLGAEQSEIEGTGLGLTLSKGLCEAMGAVLKVESIKGEGSTFVVDLAVADELVFDDALVEHDIMVTSLLGETRVVLYIEDNLSNLRLVQRILATQGNVVFMSAVQGRMGVELALQHLPDLILLDLHLPDISGEEVLATLKGDPLTREIPICVMSADATAKTIKRVLAAGAIEYLTKPLDVGRLLEVVYDLAK